MDRSLFILLLTLFLLVGLGYYYINKDKAEKTTLQDRDWDMSIKNTEDIGRIFFADRNSGKTVDLKRDGNAWTYNDKWKARPNAVENLMVVLKTVSLRERPANAAIKTMVKSLAAQGIKVEVYDKKGKAMKKFYVGGATPDERGTFMIMEGSNNPYVMHMQHAEANLRGVFFVGDKNWRDKTVFGFKGENVKSVSIDYPKNKNQSFHLNRSGKKWEVAPFYPSTRKISRTVDIDAVDEFLAGFKSIGAEAFENDFAKRDSVLATTPFCTVEVEMLDGEKQKVDLHPLDYKFKNPQADRESEYFERYLAAMNNKYDDVMLTQHIVMKKIFWGYPFFFMPERKSIRG